MVEGFKKIYPRNRRSKNNMYNSYEDLVLVFGKSTMNTLLKKGGVLIVGTWKEMHDHRFFCKRKDFKTALKTWNRFWSLGVYFPYFIDTNEKWAYTYNEVEELIARGELI